MRPRALHAERLRTEREKQGLTQHELSQRIGAGLSQIARYESGAADPSLYQLKRIASVLRVSADYLLGMVDESTANIQATDLDPRERKFLLALRNGQLSVLLRMLSQLAPQMTNEAQVAGLEEAVDSEPWERR
jgi:transcriptional regulator with XRE-family HTH domain